MADANSTRTFNGETIVRIRDVLLIGLVSYGEIERLSAAQEIRARRRRLVRGNPPDRRVGYGIPVRRRPACHGLDAGTRGGQLAAACQKRVL